MTTEILIEKVREKLGELDSEGEKILATAVKILHDDNAAFASQTVKEKFLGKNITLDEYEKLARDEKWRYQDNAAKQNRLWVENQLERHRAKWIMVVDGKVVLYGKTLDNYPEDEDFLVLCQKTGHYPFVFFSERVFAIEEQFTVGTQLLSRRMLILLCQLPLLITKIVLKPKRI
jgi:hypothetical protein